MASTTPHPVRTRDLVTQDLWKQALATLSAEDQKQYDDQSLSMLDVLKDVQEATETKKDDCISKGWKVYRNKQGEEVKLRHILEKMSMWVTGIIRVIDVGVSFDQSGHAALPWAIVKSLTTTGFSDINIFSSLVEGIESTSGLIARYVLVEMLYLGHECKARLPLEEAIRKLYAAILTYLARVKAYFVGGAWKRLGRGFLDALRDNYKELLTKMSETEVERWTELAEAELRQKIREDAKNHDRVITKTLIGFQQPIMQIRDQISVIYDSFNREERKRIFRWMSEVEYRSHHEDLSKDLLPQSGQWLLESRDFVDWGQSSVSSILWLHGIPGSGKTRLTSTVINLMLYVDSASTAFFYCARSTAEPARAKPVEILCALLRQLCSSNPDQAVKGPVAREYEARKKKADEDCSAIRRLTVKDCTRLIIELTKDHPATIILDALDECEESTRFELLEAFDQIICTSAEVVKVFVSSRDDVDIKLHLEGSRNISVSVEENKGDITRFVHSEVNRLISKRIFLDGKVSKKLKGSILENLINGAQGMFRWVEISLEALSRIKFTPDFKEALGQLPVKLAGLYDIIHAQIDQTERHGRNVATATLKWLLCAQRLLSTKELLAAVYAVDAESSEESDEDEEVEQAVSPENDILRLCRNLVVLDSKQETFRFAHQSVREYLLEKSRYTVIEQHSLATERCLDVYLTESLPGSKVLKIMLQNAVLKDYAQVYWPVHYKYIEDGEPYEITKKMSRFLLDGPRTSKFYIQWALDFRSIYTKIYGNHLNESLGLDLDDRLGYRLMYAVSRPESHLCAAYAFGLLTFLKQDGLSGTILNQRQEIGRGDYTRPLIIAAEEGHDQVVQIVLDKGADVNAQGGKYGNALQAASYGGHNQVVQMLLHKGADVNAQGGEYGKALQAASLRGFIQVVQILLDKGANINTPGGYFGTALHAASYGGHNELVQIFLDRGADINAQDEDGCHALHVAAANGHIGVLDCLITRGANTKLCDNQMKSVLHHGICGQTFGNDIETVEWLLAHQVTSQDADVDNMTPLHLAVISNRDDIAGLLLQHSYSVDIGVERKLWLRRGFHYYFPEHIIHENGRTDSAGLTPLHAAALFGSRKMVGFLLDHRADPNAFDRTYGTPLHLALKGSIGQPEIEDAWSEIRNYVESSLDVLIDDPSADNTDIYDSVFEAREATINILLDCESVDVTIKKENGQTLLHELQYGKRNTYNHITRILAKGADINAKDTKSESAFCLAAREGDYEALQEYLKQGADPLMEDDCGRNLLHSAAEGHCNNGATLSTIKLLLRHQTARRLVYSVDKTGQNALHLAVSEKCTKWTDIEIIKHLVASGVDTNAVDNEGRNPLLHYITSAPLPLQTEVIRLLANDTAAQINDPNDINLAHRVVQGFSHVDPEIFKILGRFGVCITAIDPEGRTVIHHAAMAATLDDRLLRCLIDDWGLDIEKRDKVGMTALDYAIEISREDRPNDCFQASRWDQIVHTLRVNSERGL